LGLSMADFNRAAEAVTESRGWLAPSLLQRRHAPELEPQPI